MAETVALERDEIQLVVFNLAKEVYGLSISEVVEIIRVQEITEVPRTPEFVEGVINLRGRVIPVVDLRKRFKLPVKEHDKYTRIVVVKLSGHTVGMIVDAVSEVRTVPVNLIEPASPIVAGVGTDYLQGIVNLGETLIILLDVEKVLTPEEKDALVSQAAGAPQAS